MVTRTFRGFIVLLFLALIVPGSYANAVEYGGLGGVPANPDPNNPRSKSIFIYNLAPGQSKLDAVNVVNNTNETKIVEVYVADSEIASGGSFACRQKVDPKEEVGRWINVAQSEISLAPLTNQVVPFEVKIPDGTSVGEHNGCVVIQEKNATPEQAGNGVQLSFRSAIRVAITVPGDIRKNVEFTGLNIRPEPKNYIITAQLNNKGNVSLDTDVQVSVRDIFGRSVYKNGGVYPLLAQKNTADFNFEFPRPFWGGFYTFTGTAEYNGDTNARLGDSAPKNIRKYAPKKLLFILPNPVAIGVELLLLAIILTFAFMITKRIRNRKKVSKSWESYAVQEGDTLIKLASKRHTKWKTIAKINKIRAPYELHEGMNIRLPIKRNKAE